jgi:predicted acyltransferase
MSSESTEPSSTKRLASLDQFRGYTVLGMMLVNFLGAYQACPRILKHTNDYCSYADTIMPHFFFAVGFAMRLTYGRKYFPADGWFAASRMVRRILGLLLVSFLVYHASVPAKTWEEFSALGWWGVVSTPLKREWFQTLTHIAVTSLWILPVVPLRSSIRWTWLVVSTSLHALLSFWFNFEWIHSSPGAIDGGPLGFLSWAIPTLLGTIACDWYLEQTPMKQLVKKAMSCAAVFMLVGYAMSCATRFYDIRDTNLIADAVNSPPPKLSASPVLPTADQWAEWAKSPLGTQFAEPPFVPPPNAERRQWNYWMMSQKAGSISYQIFAAGLSLALFNLFFLVNDIWGRQWSLFRTFGTNALIVYVLHGIVIDAIRPFVPKDAPLWYLLGALVAFFIVSWVVVRHLERQKVFFRV